MKTGDYMDKCVWKARILPGKYDEYVRRHNEIWPEVTEALNKAGIHNYTIWSNGDEIFGYYECKDLTFTKKALINIPIFHKWREYMKDVMVMDTDSKTNKSSGFIMVFHHE
jgi:L-rhamnose mutarotase